ncbi:taste receptor type 2 member 7-like [Gracilinanus agilis]|uniref:taste receptor type 2 member 7-like n=1 Tax=Gracilinanus agilis TaxID=191870 RepID=UPI001CFD1777|nr:taste receptor type 2 member 7-like [Gracilinanus agilis]
MLSVPENICLIMLAGEAIMGILINVFIGLVNCIDWVKSRKISLVNFIFLSLAFSRICLLLLMLVDRMLGLLYRHIYETSETFLILSHLWMIASYSNISFVTCLSVFYFLKIAHFSHPLFLWLKWRMNRVVLMILLGSSLMFLFISLLEKRMVEMLGVVIAGVYPSVHPFILILGNNKLRQSSLWMWRHLVSDFFIGPPDSGPLIQKQAFAM